MSSRKKSDENSAQHYNYNPNSGKRRPRNNNNNNNNNNANENDEGRRFLPRDFNRNFAQTHSLSSSPCCNQVPIPNFKMHRPPTNSASPSDGMSGVRRILWTPENNDKKYKKYYADQNQHGGDLSYSNKKRPPKKILGKKHGKEDPFKPINPNKQNPLSYVGTASNTQIITPIPVKNNSQCPINNYNYMRDESGPGTNVQPMSTSSEKGMVTIYQSSNRMNANTSRTGTAGNNIMEAVEQLEEADTGCEKVSENCMMNEMRSNTTTTRIFYNRQNAAKNAAEPLGGRRSVTEIQKDDLVMETVNKSFEGLTIEKKLVLRTPDYFLLPLEDVNTKKEEPSIEKENKKFLDKDQLRMVLMHLFKDKDFLEKLYKIYLKDCCGKPE